jgi:hypothetical protein
MHKRVIGCIILIQLLLCSCTLPDNTGETDTSSDASFNETITQYNSSETCGESTETPYHAGSGKILFDIYHEKALADLDADGSPEEITFESEESESFLYINGIKYIIDIKELAQAFAIADIDINDSIMEIVLTGSHKSGDMENSGSSTYIFWWNGSSVIHIGTIPDIVFDGSSAERFDPSIYFDAAGSVYIPTMSTVIEEIWYRGLYLPSGENRMLEEEPYITEPINDVIDLELNNGYMCALLFDIDEKYFDKQYNVIWDYASWPHINGREIDPEPKGVFSVIAAGPEKLEIIQLFGGNWLKLRTYDGYEGWICIADNKIKGYDKVMYIDIFDMFRDRPS